MDVCHIHSNEKLEVVHMSITDEGMRKMWSTQAIPIGVSCPREVNGRILLLKTVLNLLTGHREMKLY